MSSFITKPTALSLAVASACALLGCPAWAQDAQAPAASAPASAPAASAKAPAASSEVQQVMVTATRFSTSLQRTPLAVTAITQEALAEKGVSNLIDLNNQIPNVQITDTGGGQPNVVIRGITGTTTTTEIGEGAVGYHIDGVYQPRPQAAKALMYDLRQVEVLRGPQGTLFGRNSVAGSINILPEKPNFSGNEGSVQFEAGTRNLRNVTIVQNLAVNERLAFRIAANKKTRDSFLNQLQDFTAGPAKDSLGNDLYYPAGVPLVDQRYNVKVDPSKYYGAVDQSSYRIGGLFKATDRLTLGLTLEQYNNDSPGGMAVQDCASAVGTKYACRLPQDSFLANVPGDSKQDQTSVTARLNWRLSDVTQIDFVSSHMDVQRRAHVDGSTAHPFDFNIGYVFRKPDPARPGQWLSAYGANGCATRCVYPVNDIINSVTDSVFRSNVNELQLKQSWDKIRYVAGLFAMHETNRNFSANENMVGNTAFASPNFSNYFSQVHRTIESKAVFSQADWDFAPTWTATLGARYTYDKRTDRDGIRWDGGTGADVQNAYYQGLGLSPDGYNLQLKAGQPGWRPHTGLDLTTGMGAWDIGEAAAARLFKGKTALAANEANWSKTTWRLGVKKEFDKANMVYGSVSTGFKAGGFNDIIDYCGTRTCASGKGPDLRFPTWQPETVTNYELGYKGNLFDRKLSVAVAVFKQDYKDLQQVISQQGSLQLNPGCTVAVDSTCDPVAGTTIASISRTANVGRLSLPGAEVEWTWRPVPGFTWNGFASYMNPKMHDTVQLTDAYFCTQRQESGINPCPLPNTGADQTLRGKRLYDGEGKVPPNTPKRTFASTFSYRFDLDNGWSVVPRVSGRWQDKVYFDFTNLDHPNFGKNQAAYAKYDAGLRVSNDEDTLSLDFAVRNLRDIRAKTSAGQGPGGTDGAVFATYIEPRVYSVRLLFKY